MYLIPVISRILLSYKNVENPNPDKQEPKIF